MMLSKFINTFSFNVADSEPSLYTVQRCGLAVLTGLLMALPFLYGKFYICAWFGFVPLMLAVQGLSIKRSYLLGTVAGLSFFIIGNYWILTFIMQIKGYSVVTASLLAMVYWLYCSQIIAIIIALWCWCYRKFSLLQIFIFPFLVVTFFSTYPWLFPIQLGESQSYFLLAIQGTDLTGVYGLDFLMALSNAVIYLSLTHKNIKNQFTPLLVAGLLMTSWFIYGVYNLYAWDKHIDSWGTKKIGMVQSNETPSINVPTPKAGFGWSFPPEMPLTQQLAKGGAEIVFWPESRYKGFFASDYVKAAYKNQVRALKVPLVFQDMESTLVAHENNPKEFTAKEFNTLSLISKNGELAGQYRKVQRIAFGEYVPFEKNAWVRDWSEEIFGDFIANLSKGDSHQVFEVAGMRLIPAICYEVLFPRFIAQSVGENAEGSVLAVLSNDGWFGQSRQPYQHGAMSSLRAVENRLPLIHVINNGPSMVVLPNGRVLAKSQAFVQSALLVDMPYSNTAGGSFFSRHPSVFIYTSYAGLLFLFALALFRKRF